VKVSAKADYAVRAASELAAAQGDKLLKAERIADAQGIPIKFLEAILLDLKHAGIAKSMRGSDGGYALAQPASDVSIADVIRAVDGPLANVRGERPEDARYVGAAEHLTEVWIAVRAALREVLEHTTLQDMVSGRLPERVGQLTSAADAWQSLGRGRN
jgi:Rrf2 family protein